MSDNKGNVSRVFETFTRRVEADIAELKTGQTHALILLRNKNNLTSSPTGQSIERIAAQVRDAVTRNAELAVVNAEYVAIWLPRTNRSQAVAQARIARLATTNALVAERSGATHPGDIAAMGLVMVSAGNWDWASLHQTARVTVAFAALSGTNSLRVADQAPTSTKFSATCTA
ncbi:MAG: hypothetical protein AAFX10_13300 [Pseudomonadota bacterium]